jgi:N-acyl-D-amino-acid deacylase
MRHPWTAIASDGRLTALGDGHPHPARLGTFPCVLGVYVRERGVITLEDAARNMTSLPTARMCLANRGRIAEGLAADLVVFDPARVTDRTTFQEPHQYPDGIPFVTVDGGEFIDVRPGRVLRRLSHF